MAMDSMDHQVPTLNGKVDEHRVKRLLPKCPAKVHVDQATINGDHEVFLADSLVTEKHGKQHGMFYDFYGIHRM